MKRGIGLAVVFAFALAGCSSAPVLHEMRDAPTGIGAHEEIAFLLATYGQHSGIGRLLQENEFDGAQLEQFFDECLRREMLAQRGGLHFIPAHGLRATAFPGETVSTLRVPTRTILERLADRRPLRLRYVIVLDGTHWESRARAEGSGGGGVVGGSLDVIAATQGSGGGGFVGASWQRVLSLRATVLDLEHRRVAGSILAYASGERAAGIGIVAIIPVPFYYSSMPEVDEVCRKLGRALARFVAN